MSRIALSLLRAADIVPGQAAHVTDTGETVSWAETVERTLRLAGALASDGVRPADRVAILAHNSSLYFEVTHALHLSGIVLVPLNTRLALPELAYQLKDCGARLLIHDSSFAGTAASLREVCPALERLIPMTGSGLCIDSLAREGQALPLPRLDDRALAAILYTGGTTGVPKGVMLSGAALDHDLGLILADLGWPRGVRYLHCSPMFHLADLGPGWATTALLGTHVWMQRFSVEGMIDRIERHHCTATALVPSMIAMMLDCLGNRPASLASLTHLGYGAAAIGRPLLERLRARFPGISLCQFYGQTEAGGSLTCLRPEEHVAEDRRLASAGRAHAGCRVRILLPDGSEAPPGTVGEIVGASGGLFMGYLNQPEATAAALRDGWLHTGDAGYLDEDGYLYVTDRLKDMIVTGGENVASSEVEAVLMTHPAVAMAAVIGRPDPVWGEAVHAIVVPAEGQPPDEAALMVHCRQHIANYKCPKRIEFRARLPLSAVGKVRKDLLRAEVSGG